MQNWIRSKLNKLLLLLREKKKTFFVIILLAVLLVAAMIKVEYYHKDFLIKELIINQYFNNIMSSNFSHAYSLLCGAWKEKDYEEFFEALWEICGLSIGLPFFPLCAFVAKPTIVIEEQKVPLLKKHKVYLVCSGARLPMIFNGCHILVINTYNLKRYWLDSRLAATETPDLPSQKAIRNFNEIITTEKVKINSYEECMKLIKMLVKLICGVYYEDLILKEEDEFTKKLPTLENRGKVYKEYRAKSLFIFEPDDEDCYYVELHMGNPAASGHRPLLYKKCTFKVKKNGVVYDFNEVEFVYDGVINGVVVYYDY